MRVVLAFASNALFNFVIGLLLARFLGPADYGLFALAIAVAILIQTVAFDWARLAAARFYSERVRTEDPAVRATIDVSLGLLILGVAAVAAAVVLSGLAAPLSAGLTALAVSVAIANGVFDYSTALVRARFRDDLYMRLITGKNVLSLLLTVGGAFWFGSARAALLGVTLSMAFSLFGVRRGLADLPSRRAHAQPRLAARLFGYGLPIVLANLFYQSIPLADRLVLARVYGLAEAGQFSFAYDVGIRIVAAVGSMLDVLLFQLAVRADEIHGVEQGQQQAGRNVGIVLAVLAPACVGLYEVLPSFDVLAAPPEFRGAFSRYLGLLMPGLFCYGAIFFALHPIFQINRTTGPLVAIALLASLVNLGALAALPATTNSFPTAQAIALTTAAVGLAVWALVLRPVWPPARDLFGAVVATAVMATAVELVARGAAPGFGLLALQIGVGGGVYGTAAWLLDLGGLRSLRLGDVLHVGRPGLPS